MSRNLARNAVRLMAVAARMSVTLPGAPLSGRPAGVFNGEVQAPGHLLYFEPTHKRIRVEFGGETIADTTGAHLLYETGLLPVYYIPEADVRTDLLTRTDHTTHCPVKGDAASLKFVLQPGILEIKVPFEKADGTWKVSAAKWAQDEEAGFDVRAAAEAARAAAANVAKLTPRVTAGEFKTAEAVKEAIENALAPRAADVEVEFEK